MQAAIARPAVPVGKIKSFGPFGPKYEVGQAIHRLADGDWMIEVTMVETGEKAEYRLTHMTDDPEAL
jgi:nitrogen fixation protein FixH